MDYTYLMPTKVEHGVGLAQKTGTLISPYVQQKVLIVTDKGIRSAGLLHEIETSLNKAEIKYEIFDEVEPNPSAELIGEGLSFFHKHGCDALLAVGGGSSIDTAKGIAVVARNKGDILDYEGVGKIENEPSPVIAIPTNAGTGSEVTASTIVTNKKTLFKAAILSPLLFPKLAILDPLLTVSSPPSVTAATGMDALTHAIESYLSKKSSPLSEAFAIRAIQLIKDNIHKAYFVGTDIESRDNMLIASTMAGAAFAQSRLGNVHAISQAFGGIFNIPHGIANATLLPFVLKYNLPACPEKMRDIAMWLGVDTTNLSAYEAGEEAIKTIIEMNKAFGIPDNIKDLGVKMEVLQQLIDDSMKSGNVHVNPRLTTSEDVKNIILNSYEGILSY
ncbi:iron-containing alcohol dehydrogenase [Fictibacillus sp. UD]|uniref:iron-containing alcohol dehydrogenase n=1 Tax=Fictibacillus sp. UD TaxID=3038777 RepID=UPI00374562C5